MLCSSSRSPLFRVFLECWVSHLKLAILVEVFQGLHEIHFFRTVRNFWMFESHMGYIGVLRDVLA